MTTQEQVAATFSALRLPLRAYLRNRVRDPVAAEDLVQQVFVKALATLQSGRAVGNLTGWLYAVARTTAIDYHRSRRVTSVEFTDSAAMPESDDVGLREELASCLRPFVDTLPAIYRDTLIATDFLGQSIRTVADKSGLSMSAVKSRASRARRLLKARLLECCDVEVAANGAVLDYRRRPGNGGRPAC